MEKLRLHTPDLTAENVEKLAALFPNCVTEARDEQGKLTRAVDFDQLRQELSTSVVEGPRERYHLDWPGKREALLAANAPIAKTLRPCREESVDFDTTKNLFIEGDNLDALKLLQEAFLNAVKMIYIDPPYNKDADVLYKDNFAEDAETYFRRSNQTDETGNRMVANTEANGRRHSDWLSLMYSRLRLAKNLLRDDGVVFISIDSNEEANLRRLCDEVFGSDNFVGTIIWKNVTDNNPTNVATEHESLQVFARSKDRLEKVWKSPLSDVKAALVSVGERLNRDYKSLDALRSAYARWFRENKAFRGPLDRYKYIDEGGVYTGSQSVHNPGKEGYRYDVIHPRTGKPCKEPLLGYRFPPATMNEMLKAGEVLFGDDEQKIIELKVYAKDYADKLSSVFELDGRLGPYDLKELFPELKKVFTNPKPVALIEHLASFSVGAEDIVLDFFAGSGTTAQAIMSLNAQDNGRRRFVLVQLDEAPDAKSDALNAGYSTIAQICRERLRRAGSKIRSEVTRKQSAENSKQPGLFSPSSSTANQSSMLDTGFRALKIDTSNMKDVYYTPDAVKQGDLLGQIDNIRDDRTPEDLLFQVLVDWGVDLALPIATEVIAGKTVFFVDGNALAACFEGELSEDFIKELAKRKPLRAVFRDNSYASDSVKINVEQLFKLLSPSTEIKSL